MSKKVKKKITSKQFAEQKRRRRNFITFVRMCRYGVNSFTRNTWLTVAATAMMTLTLFVILLTFSARNILVDSAQEIRDKIDMSIYINPDTSAQDIQKIRSDLVKVHDVKSVTFISPEEARKNLSIKQQDNSRVMEALNKAKGDLPGTFRVVLDDPSEIQALKKFTDTNQIYKKHENRTPSFETSKIEATNNINRWVNFAEKVGITVSLILAIVSIMVVFNTIRMAIFNRQDDIIMMKLIGADKGFIRGPFFVEAIMYGFIAAILATLSVLGVIYSSKDKLNSYEIAVNGTLNILTTYIGFVLVAMILLGALIGVVSSYLATRKYLKI